MSASKKNGKRRRAWNCGCDWNRGKSALQLSNDVVRASGAAIFYTRCDTKCYTYNIKDTHRHISFKNSCMCCTLHKAFTAKENLSDQWCSPCLGQCHVLPSLSYHMWYLICRLKDAYLHISFQNSGIYTSSQPRKIQVNIVEVHTTGRAVFHPLAHTMWYILCVGETH